MPISYAKGFNSVSMVCIFLRKQILQSVINCDVNRLPKRMKFVENGDLCNCILSKNSLTGVKNVIFENINFDYDVMKRHKPLYDPLALVVTGFFREMVHSGRP